MREVAELKNKLDIADSMLDYDKQSALEITQIAHNRLVEICKNGSTCQEIETLKFRIPKLI